jgi:hypothetical protein
MELLLVGFYQIVRKLSGRGLKAPRAVRQWNMVMRPMGPGTKNHCAGEDLQQFSSQLITNNGAMVGIKIQLKLRQLSYMLV